MGAVGKDPLDNPPSMVQLQIRTLKLAANRRPDYR